MSKERKGSYWYKPNGAVFTGRPRHFEWLYQLCLNKNCECSAFSAHASLYRWCREVQQPVYSFVLNLPTLFFFFIATRHSDSVVHQVGNVVPACGQIGGAHMTHIHAWTRGVASSTLKRSVWVVTVSQDGGGWSTCLISASSSLRRRMALLPT